MSKSARFILALAMVGFVAACAAKEEEVVVVEPVTAEPEFTGKYK
jgi:hypothetical protein